MNVFDSNIIIYAFMPEFEYLRPLIAAKGGSTSIITKIEVWGFRGITPSQQAYFHQAFSILDVLPLSDEVAEMAIQLRKTYKIKLGDGIIAATALVHNAPLYTRNLADFQHIPGLIAINPVR